MSPRPDRRSDFRSERGPRRSAGGPPGRGAGRPSGPSRPSDGRRGRWAPPAGEGGGERPRFRREERPAQGEWTPRERPSGGLRPARPDGGRFGDQRPPRDRFGEGRPAERRFDGERPAFDRSAAGRPSAGRAPSGRPPLGAGAAARDFRRPAGRPGMRPAGRPQSFGRPPGRPLGPVGGSAAEDSIEQGEYHAGAAPSDLIWGRHAAQAALESGRPIHRVWCTPEMRFSPRFLQQLREAKAGGVLVEEVTWARLGQISGGAVHQGIVLQPAAADTLDLPSLIDGCRALGEPPLLIAVDGLTDPQNLGAIVRSAEALGAHGMVLPQRRNAGLTGSVAKVAAGALEHLPVARVVNLNRSLDALKDEGYRVIGLAAEGTVTLEEADLEGPLVVVTGSEGDGLSLLTRRSCDQLVRIPLRGATPSLNASVATALLLFEIARRGWMQGLRGQSPAPRIQRPALATEPAAPPQEAPEAAAELIPAALDPGFELETVVEPETAVEPEQTPEEGASAAWSEQPDQAQAWAPGPLESEEGPSPWLAALEGASGDAGNEPSPWTARVGVEPSDSEDQAQPFQSDIRL